MDKWSGLSRRVSTDSLHAQITKRRSWDGVNNLKREDMFASPLLRHKLMPVPMTRSCDCLKIKSQDSEKRAYPSRKSSEDTIHWDSLPPELVNLGKEVLQQRDAAVLTAAQALQEAAAADRLIRCLSSYTELQSKPSDDGQPSVEKFFGLQDD
ncbi:hypothetical protein MLD38_026960 [Melastoma candidum]|uniref:Uncharacterized protein n=1 Tax=Melastoma candidum TaxID=119954 RepID=A0ACB9P6G2_9MYRT|nr:hypothetical protein MLD38_026960 [Melastoma candidum]